MLLCILSFPMLHNTSLKIYISENIITGIRMYSKSNNTGGESYSITATSTVAVNFGTLLAKTEAPSAMQNGKLVVN